MEIAQHARAAETLLCKPGWAKSDLRDSLAALAKAFASPREAAETPIPDSIVRELAGQRIALIGFADEEGERLCAAFARVRALPQLFTGAEPPQSNSIRDCSVAMVHVRPATCISVAAVRFPAAPPLVLVAAAKVCSLCLPMCRPAPASS